MIHVTALESIALEREYDALCCDTVGGNEGFFGDVIDVAEKAVKTIWETLVKIYKAFLVLFGKKKEDELKSKYEKNENLRRKTPNNVETEKVDAAMNNAATETTRKSSNSKSTYVDKEQAINDYTLARAKRLYTKAIKLGLPPEVRFVLVQQIKKSGLRITVLPDELPSKLGKLIDAGMIDLSGNGILGLMVEIEGMLYDTLKISLPFTSPHTVDSFINFIGEAINKIDLLRTTYAQYSFTPDDVQVIDNYIDHVISVDGYRESIDNRVNVMRSLYTEINRMQKVADRTFGSKDERRVAAAVGRLFLHIAKFVQFMFRGRYLIVDTELTAYNKFLTDLNK